jgi:hypothetical protein
MMMSQQKNEQDDQLDEALEETFPASDPPAETVQTGTGIGPAATPRDGRLEEVHEVDPAEGAFKQGR